MIESKTQGTVDAPIEKVWDIATDPERQIEWWPDQLEYEQLDPEFVEGCRIRSVVKRPWPMSDFHSTLKVEEFEPGRELYVRCQDSGSFTRIVCTEAQGCTFVELTAGNKPVNLKARVMTTAAGKRFFRRWVDQALTRMRAAAETGKTPEPASSEPA